ncbi:cytochrome P450 monooxygenase pc-3 [Coprinopsis sp. MPI-PUGE-AT-0042]|nr:cytochrome P450 monooxygenase pc-3 [Coprinopsis sp. MPI-PUGE-AT-0042]
MATLPPGIVYLIQNLPTVVLPPSTVVLIANLIQRHTVDRNVPLWTIVLATLLSLPAAVIGRMIVKNIKDARDAAKRGAVLPKRVRDDVPAGLGLLKAMVKEFESGYPGDVFQTWVEGYGNTCNFRILGENRFFTIEPDYIKAMLATQFDNFEKGPVFEKQMDSILGTGVFNSDGEMWKFHRSMTRPFFTKDRISHFDIFDRHAADALNQLKARLREGHPRRHPRPRIPEFLFAKDVQSLTAGIPYPHYSPLAASSANPHHPANEFSKAFDEAQRLTAMRSRVGVNWPLAEFWQDRVKQQMKVIDKFIDPILATAIQRKKESGEVGPQPGMDREKVLRDETLNILLAGRDTTTNSITWSIYMLSQHPEVLARLRQEVLEKVGETRRPTFEDMKDMKYLRAVINETLRLYPAVSSNKPVVLRSKNGGQDQMAYRPDKFDPDRFLDERVKKYITPNPSSSSPSMLGPRICLGQQFAYHETSFFLIRLLQQFKKPQPPYSRPPEEWKNSAGTKGTDTVRIKTYLTMSILVSNISVRWGCWVTMEEASPVESV